MNTKVWHRGFDIPEGSREDDHLNRWRFAVQIVEVIKNTPEAWSVRVGVFGRWGEGKSTVLKFAEQMLKEHGNLVCWFNPWAVTSLNSLWVEFARALHGTLQVAGIKVESTPISLLRKFHGFIEENRKTIDAASELGDPVTKAVYSTACGALQGWLTPNGEQIKAIRTQLGSKRLVVFVDDVDRADPKLVPQLLLSLRELLDLPGFSFVLAFDDRVVGEALREYHPAWIDGQEFLEKILDFRFRIPAASPMLANRLLTRVLDSFCPFVPRDSSEVIRDLLPSSPRKLKSMVRGILAMKAEIERHAPEELSWTDIWLAQLLSVESEPFLRFLLSDNNFDEIAGFSYGLHREAARQQGETYENEPLKGKLAQLGIVGEAQTHRLLKLIEALRARAGQQFVYFANLAVNPNCLTWKEFESIRLAWKRAPAAETVARWVDSHANVRSAHKDDVVEELFGALIERRKTALREASGASDTREQQSHVEECLELLAILDSLISDLYYGTPTRFKALFNQFITWITYDLNECDRDLREAEKKVALRILRDNMLPPIELLEALEPWGWRDEHPENPRAYSMGQAFRKECANEVIDRSIRASLQLFGQKHGIRRLWEPDTLPGQSYCLFHRDSPLRARLRTELFDVLSRAPRDITCFNNSRDFLSLVVDGCSVGHGYLSSADFLSLIEDHELIGHLWSAVTCRQVQYRTQPSLLKARQLLISRGVPDNVLPLTTELDERDRAMKEGA